MGNHSADLANRHKARTQKSAILVSIHQKLRKHHRNYFDCFIKFAFSSYKNHNFSRILHYFHCRFCDL
ncbi:hypothetical protein ACWIUD_00955 [Helicobacter sp. 23-1044]